MSHCREKEWDGAHGGLQYSASLSRASCFTLLWISAGDSTSPAGPRRTRPLSEDLRPEEDCYSRCDVQTLRLSTRSKIRPIFHPNALPVSPKLRQSSCPQLFRCASLPVPSLIQSEEGEECPIYEFCSVQWHIVIRNHREQSPLSKHRGHSACLAMRQ